MSSVSRNILLVEDEPTLQRILGSVLSDAGHAVESVGTAEAALARLDDGGAADVDLVLSDKNLPAMNGLELLTEVRERERGQGVTRGFVLVTGYPSRESALTVLAEGGDGYMVKPFRSLVHAVQEIQGVLHAPLAARRGATRVARRLADVLGGVPTPVERGTTVAVLIDDDERAARVKRALERAGARVVPVADLGGAAPSALVAARVEDLVEWGKGHPASGLVLADAQASFGDVVALIQAGGGAVFDAAMVPA